MGKTKTCEDAWTNFGGAPSIAYIRRLARREMATPSAQHQQPMEADTIVNSDVRSIYFLTALTL